MPKQKTLEQLKDEVRLAKAKYEEAKSEQERLALAKDNAYHAWESHNHTVNALYQAWISTETAAVVAFRETL